MADDLTATGSVLISVAALAAAAGSKGHSRSGGTSFPHTTTHTASELLQALRGVCGTPTTTSWVVAAGVNAAVLGFVGYKLYRNAVVQHEKHRQLKHSNSRLWRLATQGGEAAGLVPEDLGQPDAAGVYTHSTATGTLYFRLAQPHPFATPHWEWSTDRAFWIPTSCADSLWYSTETTPSTADKVLIRRLEVEGQLLARQQGPSSSSSGGSAAAAGSILPPLDVSAAKRDVSSLAHVPTSFLCPISMRLMIQPVVTPSGATFDRPALIEWIRQSHTDPLSGQPLSSNQLVPNLVLRDMIHAWLQEDPSSSSSNSSSSDGLPAAAADVHIASSAAQDSFAAVAGADEVGAVDLGEGFAVLLDSAHSVSKGSKGVHGSGLGRDVLTPCTPVRTSRDV